MDESCKGILSLLNEYLIPSGANDNESKVFYLKLKGDYYRYLSEFKMDQDRKDAAENTLLAYKEAQVNIPDSRLRYFKLMKLSLDRILPILIYHHLIQ